MKTQFYKLFLIGVVTLMTVNQHVTAQDRIRETGLTFSNLNNFGLNYKTGTNRSLWRFNSLFLSAAERNEETYWNDGDLESSSYGIDFRIGREFRKEVVEHLQFRYGFDISFGFNKMKSSIVYDDPSLNSLQEVTTYTPGLDAVLGVNYVVKDKIVIGAEILPGFYYTSGKKKSKNSNDFEVSESDISGFGFNFSSSSVLLTLAYRFTK